MSETVEGIYIAEVLKDRVRLINRNYETIKEVETKEQKKPVLFEGACVCQIWENWREKDSIAYWFCLGMDKKRAVAKITDNQIILHTEGCQKE